MKDARGNTIYVGKAKDLHRRLGNYFSPTGATLSNHKTRALINAIASFDYFETRNDQEAFLLESKLIKQYRPHYNIQMKDDKRYPLLKIPKGKNCLVSSWRGCAKMTERATSAPLSTPRLFTPRRNGSTGISGCEPARQKIRVSMTSGTAMRM